jgi:GNAT superfamily N-acetyltransferase
MTDFPVAEGASVEPEDAGTKARSAFGAAAPSWTGPLLVSDAATMEKIYALREAVWRSEESLVDALGLAAAMLRDAHDAHGLHWVVAIDGSLVAAARLCIHHDKSELPYQEGFRHLIEDLPAPVASLNRLVVHPSMRRKGLSRAITAPRIEAARAHGARSIVVEAAPNRIPGLRALGFVERGYSLGQPGDLVRFTLMTLDLSA